MAWLIDNVCPAQKEEAEKETFQSKKTEPEDQEPEFEEESFSFSPYGEPAYEDDIPDGLFDTAGFIFPGDFPNGDGVIVDPEDAIAGFEEEIY